MDSLQDSRQTMWSLNVRLKSFLGQVNKLQEANQRLEAQIVDRGAKSTSCPRIWSQQEETVKELRAQVSLKCTFMFITRNCPTLGKGKKLT